jgi:uncharacterized membrane protein YphA (DoxX/SURF4 family)
MTDRIIYISFFLGFTFTLPVILFANEGVKQRAIRFLKILLITKVLLSFSAILLLPFTKPDRSGRIPFAAIRKCSTYLGSFFVGSLMTYICVSWYRKAIHKKLIPVSAAHLKDFNRLFRWATAGVFIWSGATKVIYPGLDAQFFSFSGYGTGFLIFITIIEIMGGIGLLFRKMALYSSIVLIGDMAGATYTNYHNFFSQNTPNPFSNALPSLLLQPFLITILVLALRMEKVRKQRY